MRSTPERSGVGYDFGATRYNVGSTPTTFRYTGQRQEASLGGTTYGLYYYGARWYDPVIGRFIQADTLVPSPANPQSLNRYAYVLNNPLKYTDPTGHMQSCGNGYDECGPDPSQRWAMLIYENYEQMMGEMEIWMRDHPDISYIAGMGRHLEDMEPLLMSREFTSIFSTQYRGDTLPGIADDPLGKAYAGAAFMLIGGGTFAWGAYSAQREIGKPTLGTFWSDVKGDPGLPESYNGATILDILMPGGKPLGQRGERLNVRELPSEAQIKTTFDKLRAFGKPDYVATYNGEVIRLPGGGAVGLRSSAQSGLTIDIMQVPGVSYQKIHTPK